MDGGGESRIAGRLARRWPLAVDFGNRDLGLLGVAKVGISFASWCLAIALGVYGFEVGGAVAVGVVALVRLAARRPRLALRRPARRPLPAPRRADRQRPGGHRRARRDERRGRDGQRPPGWSPSSPGSSPSRSAATCPPRRPCCPPSHAARRSSRPPTSPTARWTTPASSLAALDDRRPARSPPSADGRLRSRRRRRPGHHRRADPDRARRAARPTSPTARAGGPAAAVGARLPHAARRPRPAPARGDCWSSLIFFEGTADVLVVIMALDLLHLERRQRRLPQRRLGHRRAARRRRRSRSCSTAAGSRSAWRSAAPSSAWRPRFPALWPVAVRRLRGLARRSGSATRSIEVAAKTLLQRLGSDETPEPGGRLARVGPPGGDGARLDQRLGPRRAARDPGRAARAGGAAARLRGPLLDPAARLRGRARRSPRSTSSCCAATRSSRRCRWRPWSGISHDLVPVAGAGRARR